MRAGGPWMSWGASIRSEPCGRRRRAPGPPPGEREQRGQPGVEPGRRGPRVSDQGMTGVILGLGALGRRASEPVEQWQDLARAGRPALVAPAAVVVEGEPV